MAPPPKTDSNLTSNLPANLTQNLTAEEQMQLLEKAPEWSELPPEEQIQKAEEWIKNRGQVEELGLADLCELYNITSEEQDEDLEDDCDKNKEYGCPVKVRPKCFTTQRPLDFIYERWNDTYNLTRYDSDKELVDKIQTGKGDPFLYDYLNIYVDSVFGGTTPEKVEQDFNDGTNDLEYAKAAQIYWILDTGRANVTSKWATAWEKHVEEVIGNYSDNHPLITFQIFTIGGFIDIFENDFLDDALLLLAAIALVQTYCYLMLGNCSPIHCRCC